jgi:hypothetical protein
LNGSSRVDPGEITGWHAVVAGSRIQVLLNLEQTFDRDVFINAFPMDANPTAYEAPILSLFRRGFLKAWEPGNRDGNLASIRQYNPEHIRREGHVND